MQPIEDLAVVQFQMIARARKELHELCQPVTAVLCLLELAKMQGEPVDLREGVESAIEQCGRVVQSVERIRRALQVPVTSGFSVDVSNVFSVGEDA